MIFRNSRKFSFHPFERSNGNKKKKKDKSPNFYKSNNILPLYSFFFFSSEHCININNSKSSATCGVSILHTGENKEWKSYALNSQQCHLGQS